MLSAVYVGGLHLPRRKESRWWIYHDCRVLRCRRVEEGSDHHTSNVLLFQVWPPHLVSSSVPLRTERSISCCFRITHANPKNRKLLENTCHMLHSCDVSSKLVYPAYKLGMVVLAVTISLTHLKGVLKHYNEGTSMFQSDFFFSSFHWADHVLLLKPTWAFFSVLNLAIWLQRTIRCWDILVASRAECFAVVTSASSEVFSQRHICVTPAPMLLTRLILNSKLGILFLKSIFIGLRTELTTNNRLTQSLICANYSGTDFPLPTHCGRWWCSALDTHAHTNIHTKL